MINILNKNIVLKTKISFFRCEFDANNFKGLVFALENLPLNISSLEVNEVRQQIT